jgi:integrase
MTNAADRSIAAKMLLTMLAVQLRTGMRPGELVQLRWSAIDTSGGQIWVYRPPEHKTSHHGLDRTIFIGPKAAKLLQAWSHPADGDLIFNAPRRDSYHRKLARWLKRLKLPKVHPHQLRHNFATRVERRADEKAAQRLLGHTRLKTTRVYVDPDTTRAAELIQRIG